MFGVAGVGDLRDRVPDVPRRQELSLLDVHGPPGPGRRHQQVGLAAQKRGDLQHVDHLGDRRGLIGLVDIGQNRQPRVRLHARQTARPSASPGPRNDSSTSIRLVERRLEDQGQPDVGRDAFTARAVSSACASLSITHGPVITSSGAPPPSVSDPMRTGGIRRSYTVPSPHDPFGQRRDRGALLWR